MEFTPYPKTPRLKRSVAVTEKLDGTNAQVYILDCQDPRLLTGGHSWTLSDGNGLVMLVGSRSRWIAPGKANDNFGFAAWCEANSAELFKLGVGQHFGEWYGAGIQRTYGLDTRRFALFNVDRWAAWHPACCEVVPVLYRGDFSGVDGAVENLRARGSVAVPGFGRPEGVIVYHSAARQVFKVLLENDESPKGGILTCGS